MPAFFVKDVGGLGSLSFRLALLIFKVHHARGVDNVVVDSSGMFKGQEERKQDGLLAMVRALLPLYTLLEECQKRIPCIRT